MVRNVFNRGAKHAQAQAAQPEAPEFEVVTWWMDPGLRKLYFWLWISDRAPSIIRQGEDWDSSSLLSTYHLFPVSGWYRYGRKMPIIIGCVIETIGALIGALSNSEGMYMAGSFNLGFGSSFRGAGVLIAEIAYPQHRAKISAIVNCMYGVCSTSCSWLALATIRIMGDWSWRSLTILQAFPGILVLSLIYWIPESPRWLVAKERYEDAENMLSTYHGNGSKTNATVVFEFREMKQTLALEFQDKKSSSYLDFTRTAGNRYRIILLISLVMVSQYSATTGMVLMYMGWTIISSQYERTHDLAQFGYPQIAFIWLFSLSYQIAWIGVMAAYALDIMPYSLSAKAGILDFCYLVFVYFFYPETNNSTLEEVAKVFDGDEAKVARMDMEDIRNQIEEEKKKQSHVEVIALSRCLIELGCAAD
ncbi:hypothetical protein CSAL01_06146 [Colletotrichum salicis]|uniref:Major facilitator superfamily (MFS) profile domain-containing protein n=1 Tax=Colletotrichum salicis TaxID=1209931 RepID=A0A135V249_9PEZI|nr:hypothetical protein CSAL01_06146 [Colletotrichum salicis]